ncbi:MAG: glycosyl transferase [Spirochaetales bacterium]|nr:glycosyl transferase [Spirochaetales bacterium]
MEYGYFDENNKKYIINNPKTPVKWINYLGTLSFGGFIDHTGGVLLCQGDPSTNRITKYIQQMPASDFKGSTLYVRTKTEAGYRILSPLFVPGLTPFQSYQCHVGLNYSRIISEMKGIKTEVTFFIPLESNTLIMDVTITNVAEKLQEIDLIPVVEYTHPLALKQLNNADWIPQTMQSRMVENGNGKIILFQYPFYHKDNQLSYLTSNYPVSSFESDRKKFLGNNEYSTWAEPEAIKSNQLSNSQAQRGDNIGALMHKLGPLNPNQSKRIIILLGRAENDKGAISDIEKFSNEKNVDHSFSKLQQFWDNYLEKTKFQTPDTSMNKMLNLFNPYQCYVTYHWSRYLSYYQLGLGTRGIGFRDSSQDVLGIMDRAPDKAKTLIEKLLCVQKQNGSAMHQFNPLTMEGEGGDSAEESDKPDYYGDDHLWVILSVCEYLKETADFSFLDQTIPFYEKDKSGNPLETASVYQHLLRSLEFTRNNMGKNKMPLLGFADWNDSMNLAHGAESFFIASLYGKALIEMIELTHFLKYQDDNKRLIEDYNEIKENFNRIAWDGQWYVRYIDADNTIIGSGQNTHGKIYTNAQSWPIIAGFNTYDQGRTALDSVYKHLNTSKGIKLSTPGYNGYDKSKGGITSYPPGAKENGGIFLHANPWVMIAETILGNGNRAFEYYNQINPATKNDIIDEYEVEPYVYPQNILGDEHPQFGLGRNSWLSGTASWTYQAGTKYILGIRPDYEGLIIDPCIPDNWPGFSATRYFRGTKYSIQVTNPDKQCKGVKSIHVNGKKIKGQIIPWNDDQKETIVNVLMG